MAQSADEQRITESVLIDCDVHTSGLRGEAVSRHVSKYLDPPHRGRVDPDVGTFRPPSAPGSGHSVSIPGKLHGYKRMVQDPEVDINEALCEEFGVDYPILNTTARLDCYPTEQFALQMMPAINDMMLERFLDDHDHIYGLATLATRKPDRAAEEIDRMGKEKKMVGAYINPGGQDRALGDPMYDVMYQAAEDNDFPVVYHGAGGGLRWEIPGIYKGLEEYLSVHALGHPWTMQYVLTSLIVQGTPVKFPDLDFVFLESGIAWVPAMMWRLNREYYQRQSEAPLLEKSPEQHIRESCYFGTQPIDEPDDLDQMRATIDHLGADSIVFSSDHPHFDADNPRAIRKYFDHLSREDREKVFHGNAEKIFPRLDI